MGAEDDSGYSGRLTTPMNTLVSLFATAQLLAGFGALLVIIQRNSAPVRRLNQRGVSDANRGLVTPATIHPFHASEPLQARSHFPQVAA